MKKKKNENSDADRELRFNYIFLLSLRTIEVIQNDYRQRHKKTDEISSYLSDNIKSLSLRK